MFTFWNSYVLWLLRLETLTFSDVTLSDINVVWCYVWSQYPMNRCYQMWDKRMNGAHQRHVFLVELLKTMLYKTFFVLGSRIPIYSISLNQHYVSTIWYAIIPRFIKTYLERRHTEKNWCHTTPYIQPSIKLDEEGVVFLSTSMLEVLQHPAQGA